MGYKSILAAIVIMGSLGLQAQTVLTYENQALFDGKTNEMKLVDYVKPGNAGANQTWDFSNLNVKKEFEGTVEDIVFTELKNTFPEADVVLNEFGNKFLFKSDPDQLTHIGYHSKSGLSYIKYNPALLKLKFPFSYGEKLSGPIKGEYFVKEQKSADLEGEYEVTADAYGHLYLPGGIDIKDALRVKTIKAYRQTNTKSFFDVETTTYRWYTEKMRYPVLVLIESKTTYKGKTSQSYQAAYNQNYVEFMESDAKEELAEGVYLNVFPNPSSGPINISYTVQNEADVFIDIYSEQGVFVARMLDTHKNPGFYEEYFQASDFKLDNGVYLLKVKIGNTETSKRISVVQ
jgi:hypothetical protein